jgi:DNA invertase Pin-like site-specific DNA recombinase
METLLGRPAIYARFSSNRQDERSIDDQVRRCRAHLRDTDEQVEVFADYAVSGAGLDRPGFEALMAAVNDGLVTAIVTEDISRISRDFADAAQIFRRLQYARVPLIGIADGIDTSAKHAKLTYTLKSLVADLYLDDLRDKTLRGLEGRMLADFATGQVPYGYRTRAEIDAHGRELGKRIEINDVAAAIVKRIFSDYASGRGMAAIARELNLEGVPSPRFRMRHRWSGWCIGTLRQTLRNERYIGVWRFKETQWVKVPGTNRRLPRKRPLSETMVRERPDLQIIEPALWEAAKAMIAKGEAGRGWRRRRTCFLLSGILTCAFCGKGLQITGKAPSYYRCPGVVKGLCSNGASLRMRLLEADLFIEITRALRKTPLLLAAVETQDIGCEALGVQIDAHENVLAEIGQQIERLVTFVAAGGDGLDCIAEKMRELEIKARVQKAELQVLRSKHKKPLRRVSVEEVISTVARLPATSPKQVEFARLRLQRWTGGSPMRFDGRTLTIDIVPVALVADVAHGGAPLPSYPSGEKFELRLPVAYLCARRRDAPALFAAQAHSMSREADAVAVRAVCSVVG